MGLEDREWFREELRQQGKKPSWDNFKADAAAKPKTPEHPRGEITRIKRPAKKRTPPSYVHLQAQEILEARAEAQKRSQWPLYGLYILAVGVLVYAAYRLTA
ncbi:hypothetical protein AUR61_011180 [Stutzerimonas balearica]|uniref:hypothetical protein n=1 Tax=Stutzerimonas balearica TaxID=74829 RepID=UPI000774852D|nr:hypothetical protein [Stutzerimonas balearica]MBS4148793.1 hypothetical protein [Stutzerimonas balearica]MCZ4127690.1 hypothetical protein [Stutzerimonas balearica]OMG64410.1 hypothetical protein AUR61_011180 [Stutzerimonas balearica]WIX01589.1 hypothetical protein QK899_13785 [Pseudomonas sp. AR5]